MHTPEMENVLSVFAYLLCKRRLSIRAHIPCEHIPLTLSHGVAFRQWPHVSEQLVPYVPPAALCNEATHSSRKTRPHKGEEQARTDELWPFK